MGSEVGMKHLLLLISLITMLVTACAPSARVTSEREVSVDGQTYKIITVAQLKTLLESKDFLLVNVHIPYEGEIKGTDLFVPYNEIEQNLSKLPSDKVAKIVVYCRSGSMRGIAAKTLTP